VTTVWTGQPHLSGTPELHPVIPFALVTVALPARNTQDDRLFLPAALRTIRRRRAGSVHTIHCSLDRPSSAYSFSSQPEHSIVGLFIANWSEKVKNEFGGAAHCTPNSLSVNYFITAGNVI
jgi:hypothetical protein